MKIKLNNYKIAFIGWNPFQLIHVKSLLLSMPHARFIIEKRADNNEKAFSLTLLDECSSQIVVLAQREIITLDKKYDIIIAQTPFSDIEKFQNAKIVFLQYGYAKAPHNYGTWRALGDLSLAYGEYAKEKFLAFSPAVCVGNPRYDSWHSIDFHQKSLEKYRDFIDRDKKSLLYLPTWGDLSSFDRYIDAILALEDSYNILIKLHHNTDYLELNRKSKIEKKKIQYFGLNDDILELLSVVDVVISDYSGAIFDAIYCQRPLVLLDIEESYLSKSKKIDKESLEFSQRDILGKRVSSPMMLRDVVDSIDSDKIQNSNLVELKERLFLQTKNAQSNMIEALGDLMDGRYKREQTQQYIRNSILQLYQKKCIKDIFRKEAIKLYLYILSFWRNR
jgi:hypothetical protein